MPGLPSHFPLGQVQPSHFPFGLGQAFPFLSFRARLGPAWPSPPLLFWTQPPLSFMRLGLRVFALDGHVPGIEKGNALLPAREMELVVVPYAEVFD